MLAPFPFRVHTGESVEDRICRCVHECEGLSLSHGRDKLALLIGRGVDATDWAVGLQTNCATSALGVLAACSVSPEIAATVHPLLAKPAVSPEAIGMSMSWLFAIGLALGCRIPYAPGLELRPGDLLFYEYHGTNNNHVEWLLSSPDSSGVALHGGGGRPDNAITIATGNVLASMRRPLTYVFRFAPHLPPSPDYAAGEIVTDAPAPETAPTSNTP